MKRVWPAFRIDTLGLAVSTGTSGSPLEAVADRRKIGARHWYRKFLFSRKRRQTMEQTIEQKNNGLEP
jgi:hypothetical protein